MKLKLFSSLMVSMMLAISCGSDSSSSSGTAPNTIISGSAVSTALYQSLLAGNAGSPTSIKMKFYGLAVSLNEDCSDAEVVFDISTNPREFDLMTSPTLFSGTLTAGTYKCVIMRVSDNIKFKPDATAAGTFNSCVAGTEYTHDIYRADSGGAWNDMDGQSIPSNGTREVPVSDIVELAASINTTAAATSYHVDQVIGLSEALVIPGASTFFADFSNGINETAPNDFCVLEQGVFGFK